MALFKHFAITESMGFEFRAEAFNVFNHIEYAWLGGDSGIGSFEQPIRQLQQYADLLRWCGLHGGRSRLHGGNAYLRPAAAHNGTHSSAGGEVYLLAVILSGVCASRGEAHTQSKDPCGEQNPMRT